LQPGNVLDMETDVPAPTTSDEGSDDDAEEMEAAMNSQADEQKELVQEQDQEEEGETSVSLSEIDASSIIFVPSNYVSDYLKLQG
jgi:hypothetical protein